MNFCGVCHERVLTLKYKLLTSITVLFQIIFSLAHIYATIQI